VRLIGLAPTACAKGVVLPRAACTGTEIVADACKAPPQPVATHMLSPHGSKYRKMAIAAEREGPTSAADSSTSSTQSHRRSWHRSHVCGRRLSPQPRAQVRRRISAQRQARPRLWRPRTL